MTTLKEAQLAVESTLGTKQNSIEWKLAMTGDGKGQVDAGNGMINVRTGANSSVIQVINGGIALYDGVICRIIKPPEDPLHWYAIRATDQRVDENGASSGGSVALNTSPHHALHEYLGADQVNIDWRQITTLRVYAAGGFTVGVLSGLLPRPGADLIVPSQTVNLASHKPLHGALWSLISVNSAGALAVTDGTEIIPKSGLTLGDIPDTPAGNFRLAAVRLYAGQSAISESTLSMDIRDLRWPQERLATNTDLASEVTGVLPIVNGGTGETTAQTAINALLPTQMASRVLSTDGTTPYWAHGLTAIDTLYMIPDNGGAKLKPVPPTGAEYGVAIPALAGDQVMGVWSGLVNGFTIPAGTWTIKQDILMGGTGDVWFVVDRWDNSGSAFVSIGTTTHQAITNGVRTSLAHTLSPAAIVLDANDYLRLTLMTNQGSGYLTPYENTLTANVVFPYQLSIFVNPPSTSGSTGAAGQMAYDTGYLYVCTATDTWTRIALAW